MQIVPGIYQLKVPIPDNPLGYLNAYLLEGRNGWLLVDTGWNTPTAFACLETGLKELGLTLEDIATIIVTHVHPDHFGLAGRIKHASPKTELLTHRWEADLIESRYIKFSELQDEMATMLQRQGVPPVELSTLPYASMPALRFVTVANPDRVLYGGEIISTGVYDLEVIWTPGHSPGHICLYEPNNKILFSGDHILPTISPNVGYHVQSGDNPLGDYICALHKVENLPVTKVLPAHEHIFTDLPGRIRELINHHEARKAEIQEAITREALNVYDVSAHITWNIPGLTWEQLPPLQKRFAVTETMAHLQSMRWEGKVRKIVEENSVLYAAM